MLFLPFFDFFVYHVLCVAYYIHVSIYGFNTWVTRMSGASAAWVLPVTPYKCFSYVVMICTCICMFLTNKLIETGTVIQPILSTLNRQLYSTVLLALPSTRRLCFCVGVIFGWFVFNRLKGRAVICYTLPSRCNLHFYFLIFGHSGVKPRAPECTNARN